MKKILILSANLMILLILLLSASACAEPLTLEEIIARNGNITEEEKAEYLESLDNRENGHDLCLGPDYILDGRKIRLSRMPLTVSNPDGSNPRTIYAPLENTFYEIGDDVILIQETDENRINGRPAAGTAITLDSGIHVDSGNNTLREGSRLLILETNGELHAFYAGAGTDSSTLVIGKDLYIMNCFNDIQFHTPNGGVDIPISFATISFLDGSGYVTAGEDGTLNINIQVHHEWRYWIVSTIVLDDCSMGLILPNMTIHIERLATWFSVEVPLVEIVEPLEYGFAIDMSPTLSLEGAGEGDTVLSVYGREGFTFAVMDLVAITDIGWKHTDPEIGLVDTNMEGEIYYGFSWGPALTWAEVAGIGGFYKVGVVLSAAKSNNGFNPDDPNDSDWHVCGKDNCLEGSAFMRVGPFSVNATLVGGMISIPIISSDSKDFDPFALYYISKTFGDKSMSSLCPHWAYRLDVNVEDPDGNAIPNVSVFYKDVPEHYQDYSSATTDENGLAVLCTQTGTIEVTAELANPKDPSRPFSAKQTVAKTAETQSVTLVLDVPSKHVCFRNSAAGEPTVWPEDITFWPVISKNVILPDTVPKLSGRQFTGWNTAEDGSGTSYAPGAQLTLEDDLTLWAQWEIAGNSWYIIYNANGGTKAPGAQIVPRGQDAVLTDELPEAGTMVFTGWTPDPQTMDPVYHPGETLPYDSGKNVVVLYALWNLDPVERPVIITFDANGGRPDTVPDSLSVPQGVSTRLPEQGPSWDAQHDFLGWSDNPRAREPEWKAGATVLFDQDTTLYAVWHAHYRVIEGAGSVWTKGSGKTQRFVANGNLQYFVELRVDGLPFAEGVQISSGSTVADISAQAMETLSVGNHTVTFIYEDGMAAAPFKVRKKIPPTGDTGYPALWLALIVFGSAGLVLLGTRRRTARRKK